MPPSMCGFQSLCYVVLLRSALPVFYQTGNKLGHGPCRFQSVHCTTSLLKSSCSVVPTTSQPRFVPGLDPNNTISHPCGPEFQLALSEGVYVLRDDLQLGFIAPHPSEHVPGNMNVLDIKPTPPTAGSRLCLATLAPRRTTYNIPRTPKGSDQGFIIPHNVREGLQESSHTGTGDGTWSSREPGSQRACVFGEGNLALHPPPNAKELKDASKRKRPKNNINKSNSSFISRVMPHESFNKRMHEQNPEGLLAFVNMDRALLWLDLSSTNKAEPLTKILFTKSHPICHDFNPVSRSSTPLDIVIGFSTADIFWYDPISQKYTRLNKNGIINPSPVTEIRWLPGSENLFIAAHTDGTLIVYDKEKEDVRFTTENPGIISLKKVSTQGRKQPRLLVRKSVKSQNQKSNPVAVWKISNQRTNGLEFSPDGRFLAVVSEDGALRIIDYIKETLMDVYTSYYGGMTCVCWSPDGSYIVTGSQDDLVSIWSFEDRVLVARCPGHHSWITAVAFDPWRCDERLYRFGSVGEDGRLLLWDFSVGLLQPPRAASMHQNMLPHSHLTAGRTPDEAELKQQSNEQSPNDSIAEQETISHPCQPRAQVPMLRPVLSKHIDPDPLSWIGFEVDCIITSCKSGHIRTWDRPKEELNERRSTLAFSNPFS